MPDFMYTARDKTGQKVEGRRTAESTDSLSAQLQAEALTPLEIKPLDVAAQAVSKKRFEFPDLFQKGVPEKELQMFCRQMYSLLKSGIPIITTIRRLIETTRSQQLITVLEQVLVTLNQGESLSAGLKKSPEVFSEFFTNLVRVGESSGELDRIFLYLADYIELDIETKTKIKTAFRYPKLVMFSLLIALLVINTFVVPAFSELFKSFQDNLPLPTLILIASSNFILNYWYVLLGGVLLFMVLFHYAIRTPEGSVKWAEFKMRIPVMGWILQRITLMRFSKLFAMVLRAGLTAVEGIDLVGVSTDDAYFSKKISATSQLIGRGNSIASAMEQTELFPPLMLQMITLGEESGNIDMLLDEVAEFYQRELVYDLDHLSEAIEPILLVIVGAMVLLLALGVFLPMWDMASRFK